MEKIKEIEEAIQKLEIGKAYIRGKIDGYNDAMDNQEWLSKITNKSDMVLDAKIKNPQEYFDK